jgi:hypothetical protein
MSGCVVLNGEDCPECGFRTHKAESDGETWYRCVTDSCPRDWYESAGSDGGDTE